MAAGASYQNIMATVRPPRCAILINRNSLYWKVAASRVIAHASEVWGGRYFLIVPTDGETIDEKYWELLESYSPDYLGDYRLTVADLEDADPAEYNEIRQRYKEEWAKKDYQADHFEQWFSDWTSRKLVDPLQLEDALERQLLHRLSPFHFRGPIEKRLSHASGFGYPFTKVAKIMTAATRRIDQVILPKGLEDPTLALLVHSQTGIGSEKYIKDLSEEKVSTRRLSEVHDTMELLRRASGGVASPFVEYCDLPEGYVNSMPFALSMLHLGHYYRNDLHFEHEEPVTVVLGDTVDDFCFYYSFSRVHERVHWLPLAWLRKFNAALNLQKRRYEQGHEQDVQSGQAEQAAGTLVNLFFEQIEYGHSDRRIQLCSMSLNRRQLLVYRSQIARCAFGDADEYKSSLDCVPIRAVSTSCMARVFEQDNYANHRSMIFVDGKSVSVFDTPRPKAFREIRLGHHYWMTSIRLDDYQPPVLPELGPKIVNIHDSTTLSRVAADGIVYLCPNSIIFGSDLDAMLVRPKIEMPDTMTLFREYFAPAGVTVQYSDKGNYFLDTLRRFGGLDETGKFIKDATTRSVLEKFVTKPTVKDGTVVYLDNDQRAYINLEAVTASLGNEDAAADLVDSLVGKEILQRGYLLRCERCRLKSWYSIDGLTSEFTCNRCGLGQQFTRWHWRMPAQPHWYYRLAETIYQFYDNDSHLTVQILYKLKSESKVAFHFAPEIELFGFPNPKKKSAKSREMDVACILDGQLVFGECKTEPLRADALEKFETLAGMPIKYPGRVIFATTRPVSADFRERAAGLPQAEILVREDLYND